VVIYHERLRRPVGCYAIAWFVCRDIENESLIREYISYARSLMTIRKPAAYWNTRIAIAAIAAVALICNLSTAIPA
jgi:hypothetical protein